MYVRASFCAAAAGGVAMLGACLLPSVDLLGTPPVTQDAGIEASRDGTAEAAPIGDGAADGAAFDCVGATFCATFDTSPDVGNGWTNKYQSPGSTLVRDTTHFRSPPAGFLSTTVAGAKNDYFAAALYKQLARGAATVFRFRFAVRVLVLDPTDRLTIADLIHNVDSGTWSSARIWLSNGTVDVEEEASASGTINANVQHTVNDAWPMDQWMAFDLTIDVAKREATLQRDGVPLLAFPLTTPWTGPDVEVDLGVFYSAGAQTGNQLALDDARLDLLP